VGRLQDSYTGILFGEQYRAYYYDDEMGDYVEIGELEGIVYDEKNSLFYAKSGDYYYLIKSFSVGDINGEVANYDLESDEDGSYYVCRGETVSDGKLVSEVRFDEEQFEKWRSEAEDNRIYFWFSNMTVYLPESDWVEGISTVESLEIVSSIPEKRISDVSCSDIDYKDGYDKWYIGTEDTEKVSEEFHIYASVASSLKKSATLNNGYGDYFYDNYKLSYAIVEFGQVSIWLILLFAAIFIACVIFLVKAAGRRVTDDEIHLRKCDKIPFGITVFAILCALGIALAIAQVLSYTMFGELTFSFAVFIILTTEALFTLLMSWFCMSLATRIKAGKFWRYTILYYIAKPIKNLVEIMMENLPVSIRAGAIIGGLTIVEFIVLEMERTAIGHRAMMSCFVLFKLIEIPCLILLLLQMNRIREGAKRVAEGDNSHPIDTAHMLPALKKHAENINNVGNGIAIAVDEKMKSERFKTELITNVSHDIKTPLTSIINYVDLLKKEPIENQNAEEYITILDRQSSRLKKLIEDLIEASKASTGNLPVHLELCDATVMLTQVVGEFEERAQANNLELVVNSPEPPVNIMADGRHLWRIIDNLMSNICKYALPGTRVYIDLCRTAMPENGKNVISMSFRNISKDKLNITSEELMARFVRGDSSRNTEGNGLGLSIAKSLSELMNADLKVEIDGDLYKAILSFEEIE
jgi:signal transduction histidine kinase